LYSLLVKGFKTVVVEFVDMVHGTDFLEIMHWKPLIAIPVEIVEVLTGTDRYLQGLSTGGWLGLSGRDSHPLYVKATYAQPH